MSAVVSLKAWLLQREAERIIKDAHAEAVERDWAHRYMVELCRQRSISAAEAAALGDARARSQTRHPAGRDICNPHGMERPQWN